MRIILIATMLATLSASAAGEPRLDCNDPQSNYEMKMCASNELTKAEGELKAVFERALKAAAEQYESVRREAGLETMPNMPEELRKRRKPRGRPFATSIAVISGWSITGARWLRSPSPDAYAI